MADTTLMLEPGTLWEKLTKRTAYSLSRGALQSIPTESSFLEQNSIRFLVRILANLVHKDTAKANQNRQTPASGKEFNPFLPYEEDLFVADISSTHLCLLNKFNVVDHHLLIVTHAFEDQESPLNLQDFEALSACMSEFDSLGFYNAGKTAGASQRHKHLQLVPLPFLAGSPRIPIEPVLATVYFQGSLGTTDKLPFRHAVFRLENCWKEPIQEAAEMMLQGYHAMQQVVDLHNGAYNLLITREWMLLVPRSQECFESISVNALGFAGAILVRNEQQLRILKDQGPLTVLKNVAVS